MLRQFAHVEYVGAKKKLQGTKGYILNVSRKRPANPYRAVLLDKDHLHIENVPELDLSPYAPILPYPPIHPYEDFTLWFKRWNVTRAWNLITAERQKGVMKLEHQAQWYTQHLEGCEKDPHDKSNWQVDEQGRTVMKINLNTVSIRWKDALTVDLSIPILVVLLKTDTGESPFIIDGWHRLYRAHKEGVALSYYLFTVEESTALEF